MSQEINLGGTIYVSSKRAAELTGYTQDYVGQLARAGSILAQRVSGLWYVNEDSLRAYKATADEYKPQPPKPIEPIADLESSVSFDGKDYVSAQRASKLTGYHQDYVGQLARSGKILSRQVGSRWYVDREALIEHKKYNDDLLGAVQAESVGIPRQEEAETAIPQPEEELHYSYVSEAVNALESVFRAPEDPKDSEAPAETSTEEAEIPSETTESDSINEIPIRVIRRNPVADPRPHERLTSSFSEYIAMPQLTLALFVLTFVGLTVGGGTFAFVEYSDRFSQVAAVDTTEILPEYIANIFAKKLEYHRESF